MNITKFLMVSCFILHFSMIHTSQDAYNASFQAFDKALNQNGLSDMLAQSAAFIFNNAGEFTWSKTLPITKTLGSSPEAMAVGLYLSSGNPIITAKKFPNADITISGNQVLFTNLNAALAAAKNTTTSNQSLIAANLTSGYTSQVAWNTAFLAFGGGGSDPVAASRSITPNSMSYTAALAAISSAGKTQEAEAIAHFMSLTRKDLFTSSYSDADVQTAITAIQATGQVPSNLSSAVTNQSSTSSSSVTTDAATDAAALALNAQLNLAVASLNKYKALNNQPQIRIAMSTASSIVPTPIQANPNNATTTAAVNLEAQINAALIPLNQWNVAKGLNQYELAVA